MASRYAAWGFVAVMTAAWFLVLDLRHLMPSDEGRYAEIAREMFASGDWVTIRYNDLKYFEKPPFHLWMTALAYHAFGVGEWQARLWVAVSGAIGLLATVLAGRRWFGPRVGWLTGLVLVATPTWYLSAHFNSLDMGVAGALACVLAGFLIAQHPQTPRAAQRRWMWFAWAAMGIAVLTKGLIGVVLPGLVLIVYMLIARDWGLWRRLHLLSGALVLLAVTLPWFVLVSMRNPEFAYFFFVHEHWQRYTSTVHHRSAPIWYFVPQLVAGFWPWLGLGWGIAVGVRHEVAIDRFRPRLLLAVWAAAIFVFFSLSGSKLPGYIVPIYPALAILAALALDRLDARGWQRQIIGMAVVLAIGLLATPQLTRLAKDPAAIDLYRSYAGWVGTGCALTLAAVIAAGFLNRAGRLFQSITLVGGAVFAFLSIALAGHETFSRLRSGVDLVDRIEAVLEPDMPIYSVRLLDHTLPFYLRRTTIMVEGPDELEFGTQQEPQKWRPTIDAFIADWSTPRHALAVMSHQTFNELQRRKVPMTPVTQDARRVVVVNFAIPAR